MPKSKKRFFKHSICIILAIVICLQVSITEAFADTKTWKLFYSPGLPPSEVITSWSGEGITTSSYTAVQVNQVGGDAFINIATSNGLTGIFSVRSYSEVSTARGKRITMHIHYKEYGTSTSRPDGYFIY